MQKSLIVSAWIFAGVHQNHCSSVNYVGFLVAEKISANGETRDRFFVFTTYLFKKFDTSTTKPQHRRNYSRRPYRREVNSLELHRKIIDAFQSITSHPKTYSVNARAYLLLLVFPHQSASSLSNVQNNRYYDALLPALLVCIFTGLRTCNPHTPNNRHYGPNRLKPAAHISGLESNEKPHSNAQSEENTYAGYGNTEVSKQLRSPAPSCFAVQLHLLVSIDSSMPAFLESVHGRAA